MSSYIGHRVLQAIPAVWGVTLIVFLLVRASGDPSYVLLPIEATSEQRATFRHAYGLDRALPVQYWAYLGHLVQGDFGQSLSFQEPAGEVVWRRLPATLTLVAVAVTVATVVALPLGMLAARLRGTWCDRLIMAIAVLGQSVPAFWMGMVLLLLLAVQLPLLPVSGRGSLAHLVMPSLTLAFWLLALLARVTRSAMLEALGEDYIRTARAKGVRGRGIYLRHALRNALPPILTIIGLQGGALIGGAVVTETVFAWPGVGTLILDAILKNDFPVVIAGVVLVAVAVIVVNLCVDLVCVVADPRIRLHQWSPPA